MGCARSGFQLSGRRIEHAGLRQGPGFEVGVWRAIVGRWNLLEIFAVQRQGNSKRGAVAFPVARGCDTAPMKLDDPVRDRKAQPEALRAPLPTATLPIAFEQMR